MTSETAGRRPRVAELKSGSRKPIFRLDLTDWRRGSVENREVPGTGRAEAMKKLLVLLAVVVIASFAVRQLTSTKGPDLTINGDEVLLATGDLDVRFSKRGSFSDTYMVFGGGHLDHRNAVANVTLAGLSVREAKPIYRRYPDFHRCASPGAALAKDKVTQLDMVPVNGKTLRLIKSSLEDFDESIRTGGDRVCVRLRGSHLKLKSVEVREVAENVTDTFKMTDFYLVDSASRVECRQALAGA
jgi:hypothetical protein